MSDKERLAEKLLRADGLSALPPTQRVKEIDSLIARRARLAKTMMRVFWILEFLVLLPCVILMMVGVVYYGPRSPAPPYVVGFLIVVFLPVALYAGTLGLRSRRYLQRNERDQVEAQLARIEGELEQLWADRGRESGAKDGT